MLYALTDYNYMLGLKKTYIHWCTLHQLDLKYFSTIKLEKAFHSLVGIQILEQQSNIILIYGCQK